MVGYFAPPPLLVIAGASRDIYRAAEAYLATHLSRDHFYGEEGSKNVDRLRPQTRPARHPAPAATKYSLPRDFLANSSHMGGVMSMQLYYC